MKRMVDSEVLVKVEGLSKKFCKDLKTGLWYGLKDLFTNISGNKEERLLREKEFWALQDINFELKRGECLGLIGHNGAGKSTLLKILNGLINPDAGKVTIKGRVGALIELGAGFNPILSGRENIYNNGAILGFSRKEIDAKIEEIIDFAEVRDFIDMPVQHYSSGMKVRLGFAIAAQMEPDVLIIDEVLAVGDVGFRMKCLTKIGSLLKNTAVIFVSHSMPQVSRISNQILLLKKGSTYFHGRDVSSGIEKYYDSFKKMDRIVGGNRSIKVNGFNILDEQRKSIKKSGNFFKLKYGGNYYLSVDLEVQKNVTNYWVNYSFVDKDAKQVANLFSILSNEIFKNNGRVQIDVLLKNLQLGQGVFNLGIAISEVRQDKSRGEMYYMNTGIAQFQVNGIQAAGAPIQFTGEWNNINL